MYACVSSPGTKHRYVRPAQPFQRFFQNALDRSFIRLSLPPRKARTVVLQHELHAA
jgi:hypothetical protein